MSDYLYLDCQWCGDIVHINHMYSVDACCEACQNSLDAEPAIGDKVYATNGTAWFSGIYVKNIDLFCQYSVQLDSGETKYFISIKRNIEAAVAAGGE